MNRQYHAIRTMATLLLSFFLAAPAAARGLDGLHWLAGEIRGQIVVVEAQAEATLCRSDEYDDVRDELEDLCERMTRFEHALAQPIGSYNDLRRLARRAEKVNKQACELQEEIDDALEDLRDDRPRHRVVHHQPAAYGAPVYRRGGIQISIGGAYGPRFQFSSQPRYSVGYPPVFTLPPTRIEGHGVLNPEAAALRQQACRLRDLTTQLERVLR